MKIRKYCLIGICNPKYLDGLKSVYSIKNKKWSTTPRELFPSVKSIIVLIHFCPVNCSSQEYEVEQIILKLGLLLLKKLGLKTHISDESGKVDSTRLVGTEVGPAFKRYDKLILLKELAYYAGLGQWGKSSLIINPRFGSDFKIQVLFTEEKLKCDSPMVPKKYKGCNDCNSCVELCPNEALSNYKIDSLKCQWAWDRNFSQKIAKPYLLGLIQYKRPKDKNYLDLFKHHYCRNCQTFCKANSSHYKKFIKLKNR